jgi:translation initiation factor 3 subunit H
MTSMAAALAASLPAPAPPPKPATPVPTIPQRMEGAIDVEASKDIESINLNSLVLLKIMKHSTDILPPPPQPSYSERNAPPSTQLGSRPDAVGLMLGLDLDGIMEVEDCFALPQGDSSIGRK